MKNDRKQLLIALREMGEASASELAARLGFGQNQQVHYRVEKLQKYIKIARREEQAGAASAAKIYTLSASGEEWVREHGNEVSLSSLSDAESIVSGLQKDVSELRADVEEAVEWHQQDQGHYSQLRQEVEEIENDLRLVRTRASTAKGDTDRLKDDVDSIENHLSTLRQQIERVEGNAEEQSERQRELSEHLQNLSKRVEQLEVNQKQVERLQERVEELEDNQPSGLLDLLFR